MRWRPTRRATVGALAAGHSAMAFARIYSGAHLPLDIVGGASLGTMVGEGLRVIEATVAERQRA